MRHLKRSWTMLFAGLAAGLLVGMVVGVVTVTLSTPDRPLFPETALHAAATDSSNTLTIATGPIDDGVEGLFMLDGITGRLEVRVINPRTGTLGGLYQHNVVPDLGIEQGKQPKYLMVTGAAHFRPTSGNVRPAQSVVYVADATTGRFVAYMLPWNAQAARYNFGQVQRLIPLGKGSIRNIAIEAP